MPARTKKRDPQLGSLESALSPSLSTVPFPIVGHGQLVRAGTLAIMFVAGIAFGEIATALYTYKDVTEARQAARDAQDIAWQYHCAIMKAASQVDSRCGK